MSSPKSTAVLAESRALLALAWPIVIAHLAQIGTGVVDTIMAGHYHSSDLAAVAIGYNIWLPLYLFVIGVSLGATYIIAQHAGAGRTGAQCARARSEHLRQEPGLFAGGGFRPARGSAV
jgi:Na+-driven multidrug efflux pump